MKRGWETKRVGEVATIKPPKAEARERIATDALVSFLPMEDLGVGIKYPKPKQTKKLSDVVGSYTYFAEGDVLLAKITPCFENGKLGIASGLENGVGFGSSEFIVLRPNEAVSNEWLFHFLSREDFRTQGEQRMGGAVGQQRVPREYVESCEVPVPPMVEQHRIVGVLDEAFAGLATAQANTEKNLQNAHALFESHLRSVFAESWESSELVTLADLAVDIADGDHMPPPKAPTGVPFITISNILKDTRQLDFGETFMVPRSYFDSLKPHRRPQVGDVLYTVTGSFGIPVIVPKGIEFCFQRHIGLVRPKRGIDSAWLYYLLLSPQIFRQASDGANGAAQRTVSLKLLRSFIVPKVPTKTQESVVANLDSLTTETRRLENLCKQKLMALAELKKSLLHQAFAGQL